MRYLIFLSFVINIGCKEEHASLVLIGNIDNKVNGKITLNQINDNLKGTFYNLDNDTNIELRGTIKGNVVNLEEYSNLGKISGFFEGTLKGNVYAGNWLSPNKKTKTPFHFKIKGLKTKISKETLHSKNNDETLMIPNLKKAYSKWFNKKTTSDKEFFTNDECMKERYDMTSERINTKRYGTVLDYYENPEFIIGHINDDKYKDAVLNFESYYCGGNGFWAINLIFISNELGEYTVFYNPDLDFDTDENIGMEYIESIKNKTIVGKQLKAINGRHPDFYRDFEIKFQEGKFWSKYYELKER